MRSRSCTVGGPDEGHIQPPRGFVKQEEEEEEENAAEPTKRRAKVQREEKDARTAGTAKRSQRPAGVRRELSRKELLQLLGIMEGEVQAREDVIGLLNAQRTRPETLEAHYGSAAPAKPLQALQRDGLLVRGGGGGRSTDDVYERPMAELDRLEDKQKETYRRMLEQLLLAEKCHRRTVMELDNEKHKHADFINKSDDFTNLLEQERERLKRLLEQEKAYQARKDQDHSRRLDKVRAELVKLKSFALTLVDERQLHTEQIEQQGQQLQDLAHKLQDKEQRLAAAAAAAAEDGQKVLRLEAELEHRAAKFAQDHEEAAARLAQQEAQSRQLRLKLAALANQTEELQERSAALQRAEEDLQELREKISKGECGNSSLVAELESLRKRVLEMEGKDEEITKTETQCRELRKKLQEEEGRGRELRLEVDKLQRRMVDLEKLEGAFSRSRAECSLLHASLEKERRVVKELAGELEGVKARLKELEASESTLGKAEAALKDDLMKMKSFTVILVDERKNLRERLKQEEQRSRDLSASFKAEQSKVTEVTEKLIEESKKLLKFKSETEVQVTSLTREKEALTSQLAGEEERCAQLSRKLSGMEAKLDGPEEAEREPQRRRAGGETRPDGDNKVGELSLEVERLKSRLKQLEVVEGDLMKTEDEYDLLEQRFRTERDKANALASLLDDMRGQIARNKAVEKGEAPGPEAQLRARCKAEEARSRELQLDVQALKEKIHELMTKEDQLSQLQADFSVLQQRLLEEEEKKSGMSRELESLSRELEATRRYSRALRPGTNGRRMVDVPLASTAVQTDAADAAAAAEDETAAGFIRKSVLEENRVMSDLRQRGLKKPVLDRYPPASAELGARKSWIPWMKKKDAAAPAADGGAFLLRPPEMTVSPKPGQPLHIRVTPDHRSSTATLEITSPRAEDFFSSTTIIPTLGVQTPRITIVPKPTAVGAAASGLDRAKSPVTITTISRAKSPDAGGGGGGLRSPVSIITVSTTPVAEACASPDPHEVPPSRTVIKMAPEKQPAPARKFNGNSSIITTEDNKIHIHLGAQFKRPSEGGGGPALLTAPMGTVLRSPRQASAAKSKMTSSITITPVTTAASRPTQSVPGADVSAARCAASRIPMSKGVKPSSKAVLGLSAVTRLESRADGQAVKIELRKSTVCSAASLAADKS